MKGLTLENRVWDPAETLPRDELAVLQGRRLAETVRRAATVPFYRDALAKAGLSPDSIRSAEDVRRLPFTVKDDLRRNYPLGLLAVPRAEIARVHGSSGTTGRPTFVAYTRRDLDTWSGLCARFLVAGGLRPEHLVHVAFGYGLFTGGFGLHAGIERVGAGVVPSGGGNTPRQVLLLRDLGSTNGTRVNGTRVRRSALQANDQLHVASVKFRIHFGPGGSLYVSSRGMGSVGATRSRRRGGRRRCRR